MKLPIPIVFVVTSSLCFAACGEEAPPLGEGTLALTWQVSPRGCESAGVERVTVAVDGPSNLIQSFDCDLEEADLDGLVPGTYQISVEGYDSSEKAIFIADPSSVTVRADVITRAPHARLTAKPASIDVEWRFDDGKVCGAKGVQTIDVLVFDKSDYEMGSASFTCDDGIGTLDGFVAGTYVVEATGIGNDGDVFSGLGTVSVGRGDDVTTEIILTPR